MNRTHWLAALAGVLALSLGAATATATAHPTTAGGKIDPALRAKLDRLPAGETVAVSIWLDVRPLPAGRRETRTQHLAHLRTYMASQRKGVVTALVRMGVTPHAAAYSPVVFAELTRPQVASIAKRADVARIYGDGRYSLTG